LNVVKRIVHKNSKKKVMFGIPSFGKARRQSLRLGKGLRVKPFLSRGRLSVPLRFALSSKPAGSPVFVRVTEQPLIRTRRTSRRNKVRKFC